MSITMYPLNEITYTAEDAQLFHSTRTNGVFSSSEDFNVTATGGMSVTVSPGLAWMRFDRFKGAAFANKEAYLLTLGTSSAALGRIDRIVLRYNAVTNDPEIAIKQGIPASTPVALGLQRDLNAWELGIADVTIAAGVSAITAGMIQDTRINETLCGVMRDGVTGIPTAQLQTQADALINDLRNVISGITAGSEHMLKTTYDSDSAVSDAGGIASYVSGAKSADSAKLNGQLAAYYATAAAATAAQTTANAAMPKSGGAFNGSVTSSNQDRNGYYSRDIHIRTNAAVGVATNRIVMNRK